MTVNVIKNSIELIGNTPMLHVKNIDTGLCNLYLKLESFNLGGSIKDRYFQNTSCHRLGFISLFKIPVLDEISFQREFT